MDYLDLTVNERAEIEAIIAKTEDERTEAEKITLAEYRTAWDTWDKYNTQLNEERAKNREVSIEYRKLLSEESQTKFDEKVANILGNSYILEDD